jgi:hypothetical protein
MPLAVIDGALSTHPLVRVGDTHTRNAFYDPAVQWLNHADPSVAALKLQRLEADGADRTPTG